MASNTSIFDFFKSLPSGFTNKQFEDRISEYPATLRVFKRSLVKCEGMTTKSKLNKMFSNFRFTPVSPPDTDNLNVNENNTNSLLAKIKPAKALVKILNCPIDQVSPIDQVTSSDLSNKFFIIANNFDHKTIGCNWKKKGSKSFRFNVYKNLETNDFKVKHADKNLISVNENVIRLCHYEYKAVCGNDYIMHVFVFDKTKLIQFVGKKPDCFCISQYVQKIIVNENKHLSPTELYLKHSDMFKNRQEISNLKRTLKIKSPVESKYKKI